MTHWTLDQQFTYRDQTVRYRTFGDGPPVVLIHGTPFSSWVWHRIAPHLARDRKVHVYDLLGYGQSERRDGQDVSLGVQNGLLAALLEHWKLNTPANLPDVVAHDFGGATALRAHLIDGCDYASLTLIDPVAVAPWGSPFVRHVREHAAAFAGLPAYIHEAVVNAYIRGSIARAIADDELAPYVAPWLGEVGQPAFYRQIAQMDQRYTDEVEARYPHMRCRTQILWGEDDEWIPIERGRQLASVIPDARFQPVPNAGHLMQEDAPEAIVAAVLRWLG
ncbi:alpha/beta fold hydrolase [Paraburkholderia sabiae]|uniref:Alpha/beta hydrolase n=1 Tax=Paraburkholderia sabiae TaxID=273251 RepID=A0ABU9QGN9_9BURK|nr:alpha/beta hydrolase [Paraburkholderia sabiae]WJZ75830.1 alpha/beta hydrolase [Paraburkholderia sabiae]CAD6554839.1 Haloalkane dehalogenase [Paraburkholderia sabiae]